MSSMKQHGDANANAFRKATTPGAKTPKSNPGTNEREKNKKSIQNLTPISKPAGIEEASPVLSKSVMAMKVRTVVSGALAVWQCFLLISCEGLLY